MYKLALSPPAVGSEEVLQAVIVTAAELLVAQTNIPLEDHTHSTIFLIS